MLQTIVSKSFFRILLTVLLYLGVALSLFPYFTGRVFTGMFLVFTGAALAVIAGLARCFLTEGECSDREHLKQRIP